MAKAIALAREGMDNNRGGPFGALVVRNGEIMGSACNRVLGQCDPTAHAEIQAIRLACRYLGDFHLEGCALYCSCEPCPMCLAAAYWARVETIFFAATREDAASIGFSDAAIYDALCWERGRRIPMTQLMRSEVLAVFQRWQEKADRVMY